MTAAEFLPRSRRLPTLRRAAARCRGCELWRDATQTVFGEGPEDAELVLVGEQPGDREDREGEPFVGPAGGVLARALEEAGIDRDAVYGEIFEHDIPDIDDPVPGLLYRWVRSGDWKLIVPADSSNSELYNVAADPHETQNLASDKPDMVESLTVKLDKWWKPGK